MFTSSLPALAKSCFSCNFILNDDFQHDNLVNLCTFDLFDAWSRWRIRIMRCKHSKHDVQFIAKFWTSSKNAQWKRITRKRTLGVHILYWSSTKNNNSEKIVEIILKLGFKTIFCCSTLQMYLDSYRVSFTNAKVSIYIVYCHSNQENMKISTYCSEMET